MRVSIGLSSRMPIEVCVHHARIAARSGLSGVWVGEHVLSPISREMLEALSDALPEVHLGTAIASIYTHTPAELYALADSLCLRPAGFSLGVGVGDIPLLAQRGVVPALPIERMEHYLKVLSPLRERGVEVLVGTRSKRMLERTSHVVDGAVLTGSVDEQLLGYVSGRCVLWSPTWQGYTSLCGHIDEVIVGPHPP